MKYSLNACLLIAFCMVASAGIARQPVGASPKPKPSYKEEAGGCNIPADEYYLDINNVRTLLLDAGDQWWNLTTQEYQVPKCDITSTAACPSAIFAGAIWISAVDQGNNLKMAALEYRQGTSDYYTGPLDNTGNVSLTQCNLWDMHFPVWATQITPIISAYAASPNGTVADQYIADSVRYWPGKGNPYLAAKGYDVSGILAPFYDADGDGIYDPAHGDYPTIKQAGVRPQGVGCDSLVYATPLNSHCNPGQPTYADEMIFWCMNDKGNVHTASNGAPMGIQVNELAFAFVTSDDLNNMTFYTYNIINKSGAVLDKTYMSQFVDPDLGCANNDRVGCDTSRSLAIVYNGYVQGATQQNGVTCDEGSVCPTSETGYGCNLPMLGVEYFEGPTDTVTTLDPTTHVRTPVHLGMTSFCYFTNGAAVAQADPSNASQFRDYQTGKWADGSPITYGGNGYGGSVPTNFVFPGDPSIASQWSECNQQTGSAIAAGDRRFVETSGPFTFLPCASEIITLGVVFVDPTGGVGSNCPSWSFIDPAADKAKALFDACFQELAGPSAPLLDLRAMDQKVIINIVDDPAGNNVGESYAQPDQLRYSKGFRPGEDSLYRFQGYIIYQLSGPTVSSSDLTDPTKAVPVAVMDIQDNVKHVVNYTSYSDPLTGAAGFTPNTSTIPGVGENLPNLGIQHSLVDSIDLIGGGVMVNHLTYYFGVISFATNNFQNFNPIADTGQSEPFLIGKNFNKFSVIPENSSSTDGGRLLNSAWGTGTQVKRLEGQANGGNYVELNAATILGIVNSPVSYLDTLAYLPGEDPLGFKVVDPIALKEADFELIVYDTIPYNGVSVSDSGWWVLNDLTNNITIHSEAKLAKPYQQIIMDSLGNSYGFAISLGTPFPAYTNYEDSMPVYGPLGGSITFANPAQPWLSFIADSGLTIVNHWIRTGTYQDICTEPPPATGNDPLCNVFVSAYYRTCPATSCLHFTDPNSLFGTMAGGTWAPYCIAANWSMAPTQTAVTDRPLTVAGPAFKWDRYDDQASSPQNTLDKLQSVDIVLTSDRSKWSQCVVFETGEIPLLDLPLAPDGSTIPPRKGMLRNHNSLLLNDSAYDQSNISTSWFPGYAINVESGQRLDVAFGEASDEGDQNGLDMIWNPTSTLFGNINQSATNPYVPYTPIFGGKHYLYVMSTAYGTSLTSVGQFLTTGSLSNGNNVYTSIVTSNPTSTYPTLVSQALTSVYDSIMWTAMPYLTPGYSMLSYAQGLIPNDVTIKLRVQKPYNKFATNATNPADTSVFARYTFSTKGLGPKTNDDSVAKSALDMIRIVPNPYLAYSVYETSANDAEVKVTNLPNNCTIKIFTLDGVLVNTLTVAINKDPATGKQIELTDGYNLSSASTNVNSAALDNSINWNLKNQANIPVASGIYLFDIDVPGVGHKVLKLFAAVRPTDVSNF